MEENLQRPLQIDDDPGQQKFEWAMQRTAWLVLTALLVAIAFGLFGRGGPLSSMEAMSEDGSVRIEYNRFLRYHSSDVLHVSIAKSLSGNVRLKMDSVYAKHIQIERITPAPEREVGEDGAVNYVFATEPGAKLDASFHFVPQKYGKLDGWIALDGGARIALGHFVYP